MTLGLPLEDWPDVDRAMWAALVADVGPLDEGGALAHLRETSRRTISVAYGRWLRWLVAAEPTVLSEPPLERATPERLSTWMTARDHLAPHSRLSLIEATLRVLIAAAPDRDWRAQRRVVALQRAAAAATPSRRKDGRVMSSAALFAAGEAHAHAPCGRRATDMTRAKKLRDGAMICFLAALPIRRRAFAGLELGKSLLVEAAGMRVALGGDMTKCGAPWEAAVPEPLVAVIRDYLHEARPILLARATKPTGRLWLIDHGKPYAEGHLGARIARLTEKLVGARVSPHLFRDAAATTLAYQSVEAARLTRAILGHSSFRTAERHYNQARGVEAGRDYAALLEKIREG